MIRIVFGFLLVLFGLAACDQESVMRKLTPAEDARVAREYLDQVRHRTFEQIKYDADPSSINPATMDAALEQMAATFPTDEPRSVKVIGYHVVQMNGTRRTSTSLEYEFGGAWVLGNVVIQTKDKTQSLVGLHVNTIPDSLEHTHRFTLVGKTAAQYLILVLAVLMPVFIISVLVLCIRTPIEKRKWLWVLFIIFAVGQIAVNWTTGEIRLQPFYFALFGGGSFSAPYGPWLIWFSLPIGAVVFLARRDKIRRRATDPETNPDRGQG